MKIIDREIVSKITETPHEKRIDRICQAALNSDGCLTIRSYTAGNKDKDTICCLSHYETEAVIKLFKQMRLNGIKNDLPF